MALKKVYLQALPAARVELPDLKYLESPPGMPVSIDPLTVEVEMSDKSRRLAFFADEKREWTLGWGYLTKTELDLLTGFVGQKQILRHRNDFEAQGVWYDVYIASFSYEFVRTGIRNLHRFRAEMTLRQV